MTASQRRIQARGVVRFDGDNFNLRPHLLEVHRNPRAQATPTNGDKNGVEWRAQLTMNLHANSALADNDVGIVKRMNVYQALGRNQGTGMFSRHTLAPRGD